LTEKKTSSTADAVPIPRKRGRLLGVVLYATIVYNTSGFREEPNKNHKHKRLCSTHKVEMSRLFILSAFATGSTYEQAAHAAFTA